MSDEELFLEGYQPHTFKKGYQPARPATHNPNGGDISDGYQPTTTPAVTTSEGGNPTNLPPKKP